MGKGFLIYHVFKVDTIVRLVIVEPKPKTYVWLYFYIDKSLRGSIFPREIVKYALYKLKGNHEIHWIKGLKTFTYLSKELRWKTTSESNFFENCNCSFTKNLLKPPILFGILSKSITYKKSKRRPISLVYTSKKELVKVLELIRSYSF
jgi:hypothetical protein